MLRDQIVAVLLAGRDTTACTLSWLFYELSRHPEVTKKLRQEVQDVVGLEGHPMPTYENLKKMRYLQVCRGHFVQTQRSTRSCLYSIRLTRPFACTQSSPTTSASRSKTPRSRAAVDRMAYPQSASSKTPGSATPLLSCNDAQTYTQARRSLPASHP